MLSHIEIMERSTYELEYLLNSLISNVKKAEQIKLSPEFDISKLKQITFNKIENKIYSIKNKILKIYKVYTI